MPEFVQNNTHESLLQASSYVQSVQDRQGLMICCPEEIAFAQGWISRDQLSDRARLFGKTAYGQYLAALL